MLEVRVRVRVRVRVKVRVTVTVEVRGGFELGSDVWLGVGVGFVLGLNGEGSEGLMRRAHNTGSD